ncbi:bifunctional folylpolyglutamate synthase/dihydrofolate synthase, partial [Streptococcus pyogenes]
FASLTVTTFDYPTALELKDYPSRYNRVNSWQDWLEKRDQDSENLYLITGSLYFISDVRQRLLG